MRWSRKDRVPLEAAQGRRGIYVQPEAGLPEGYGLPFTARGMFLDPRQLPAALMKPAMDAGQPAQPSTLAETIRIREMALRCARSGSWDHMTASEALTAFAAMLG